MPSSQMHAGSEPSDSNVAISRTGAKPRRWLLFVGLWLAGTLALLVAGLAWLGLKASTISTELTAANQLVPQLKDDVQRLDPAAAAITVRDLQQRTASAREAAADPLWTIAGALPLIGVNFQATREVATSADDVARLGAAPLVSIFKSLDWKSLLPNGKGQDLEPLASAEPKLASAADAVRQSSDRLNSINADALMPQISAPLIRARDELTSLRGSLDSAADAASILPAMMGDQSPRRYLLLIQNNAESRATGGIPGALAVLNIDKGKLTLGSQSSATAMGAFVPVVDIDPEQEGIYSTRLGKFMQDVNLTPDFPTSALTAHKMWERKTGEQVDGVLSIDPVALGYILQATGPVTLADPLLKEVAARGLPRELTAGNVVPTLLSDVYSKITQPELQDIYFAGVAKEVFSKLSTGGGDTTNIIDALTRGSSERRILLWSSNAAEQAVISQYPLGGSIIGESISPAQFGVYFNDGTGAKMDYYVKRSVQLFRECTTDGYSQVKVRVKSMNTAPTDAADSLPAYVTGAGAFGVPAGTVRTNITAYGPTQSQVETAVADGKKIGFASQTHSGRPVGTVTVELPPGKSSSVEFTFAKIVQHTEPKLSVTPTVQALHDVALDTSSEKCVAVP